jgi:IS4 transposase
MHTGRSVFSQLMDFIVPYELDTCVRRYGGEYRVRSFSCRDQFLCMAFAQLTERDSLRRIVTCLRAQGPRLYHAGFRGPISRSTVADANERRDWRIWADFAQTLIARARTLYKGEDLGLHFDQTAYAIDSTTVDLCLALFPWAPLSGRKAAVKIHTQMDLRGHIPSFLRITAARVNDIRFLDHLLLEPGAFYVMDRGYVDYARLYRFTLQAAFFVVRARENMDYLVREYHPVDKSTGLRSDHIILLRSARSVARYPETLRRVRYHDAENDHILALMTNNFALPAFTITQLYHARWQIELFFKWIKQHLCIKSFYGTSPNAVKTQIWIAMSVYVILALVKKELRLERSLSEIQQILSISPFEQRSLVEALTTKTAGIPKPPVCNQLLLFDL